MKLKKSLGQHFLSSPSILEFEATLANPKGKDVLEIGPGDGRLTQFLLKKSPKSLTAVEMDPVWASHLEERFAGTPNFKVIEGDFLELESSDAQLIVGNIPYYISSPILFKIAKMKAKTAILIVQLEFAKRMAAEPKSSNYGRLSVTSQLLFEVKLIKKIKKGSFNPPPRVDSALILLRRKDFEMEPKLEEFIRAIFSHKNQNIKNALSHAGIGVPEELPKKRARELSKEEILEIYNSIKVSLPG
ncbi:ribosomal RNA small subunit methyltransferase A [Candidatus Micrarchaeota archaeon]|nr:ribosomal RNA small subunit methyltransferase A [Candidatus Micrarchaeota archaeon]